MVFRLRDPVEKSGKNILWYRVETETNDMYKKGIEEIMNAWVDIMWIVCDWRRGLLKWFWDIPTQMCQFHMKALIRRNIWKRPILDQHKQLKDIGRWIWKLKKETIIERIKDFEKRESRRLKEKNDSWWYVHRKARKTLRSLKFHINYLYTYQKYDWMPRTTNSSEWNFWWAKTKWDIHRGMTRKRTEKFINRYLNST